VQVDLERLGHVGINGAARPSLPVPVPRQDAAEEMRGDTRPPASG
jgi:hypothetical protein